MYRSAPHCSYCGRTGHNRATCPDLKKRVERLRVTHPSSLTVLQYDAAQRRRSSSAKRRAAYRSKPEGPRLCSFCGESGHNRRTCTKLKAAKTVFQARQAEYRSVVLNLMRASGLGPGAMIQWHRGHVPSYKPEIIRSVDWSSIGLEQVIDGSTLSGSALKIARPTQPFFAGSLHLPRSIMYDCEDKYRESRLSHYVMMAPAPASSLIPPEGWLDGSMGLEQAFKAKNSKLYKSDYYVNIHFDRLLEQARHFG